MREILYKHGLTNGDIYDALIEAGLDQHSYIIADAAEPKSIEDLNRMGLKGIRKCYSQIKLQWI